jgi:hypothetical protein
MELVSQYQQEAWWPYGIYTESILTTLIITRKFGDSSYQYGVTTWYKLLMYCVYGNRHWSLVFISITDTQLVVVCIEPISPEMNQDTQYILDHLKWANKMGPWNNNYTDAAEDVLIDITTPPPRKTPNHVVYGCYNITKTLARE